MYHGSTTFAEPLDQWKPCHLFHLIPEYGGLGAPTHSVLQLDSVSGGLWVESRPARQHKGTVSDVGGPISRSLDKGCQANCAQLANAWMTCWIRGTTLAQRNPSAIDVCGKKSDGCAVEEWGWGISLEIPRALA